MYLPCELLDIIGEYSHHSLKIVDGQLIVKKKRVLYYYSVYFEDGGMLTTKDCVLT